MINKVWWKLVPILPKWTFLVFAKLASAESWPSISALNGHFTQPPGKLIVIIAWGRLYGIFYYATETREKICDSLSLIPLNFLQDFYGHKVVKDDKILRYKDELYRRTEDALKSIKNALWLFVNKNLDWTLLSKVFNHHLLRIFLIKMVFDLKLLYNFKWRVLKKTIFASDIT